MSAFWEMCKKTVKTSEIWMGFLGRALGPKASYNYAKSCVYVYIRVYTYVYLIWGHWTLTMGFPSASGATSRRGPDTSKV